MDMANGQRVLAVVDGTDNSIVKVPIGIDASGVAVNPVTNRIYITGFDGVAGQNMLVIVDGASNAVTSIPTSFYSYGVAVDFAVDRVYVRALTFPDSQRVVAVLDGAGNFIASVPASVETSFPGGIAVDPSTHRVYVPGPHVLDSQLRIVAVVEGGTLTGSSIIQTNFDPADSVFDGSTHNVYIRGSLLPERPECDRSAPRRGHHLHHDSRGRRYQSRFSCRRNRRQRFHRPGLPPGHQASDRRAGGSGVRWRRVRLRRFCWPPGPAGPPGPEGPAGPPGLRAQPALKVLRDSLALRARRDHRAPQAPASRLDPCSTWSMAPSHRRVTPSSEALCRCS